MTGEERQLRGGSRSVAGTQKGEGLFIWGQEVSVLIGFDRRPDVEAGVTNLPDVFDGVGFKSDEQFEFGRGHVIHGAVGCIGARSST